MYNLLNKISIKSLLFSCFTFFFSSILLGQDAQPREKGFQFNVQGVLMAVGDNSEDILMPDEFDLDFNKSRIYGFNVEAHYRFSEYWIVGLGTGYETVTHPDFSYYPVYVSLRSSIGENTLKTLTFRLDLGTQFGNLAKAAPLLRGGIGYRFPVWGDLCMTVDAIASYQGLRKEFKIQPDVVYHYNAVGVGVAVGFEL